MCEGDDVGGRSRSRECDEETEEVRWEGSSAKEIKAAVFKEPTITDLLVSEYDEVSGSFVRIC